VDRGVAVDRSVAVGRAEEAGVAGLADGLAGAAGAISTCGARGSVVSSVLLVMMYTPAESAVAAPAPASAMSTIRRRDMLPV
jgi:hypothetical protein